MSYRNLETNANLIGGLYFTTREEEEILKMPEMEVHNLCLLSHPCDVGSPTLGILYSIQACHMDQIDFNDEITIPYLSTG